jgi:hypothetical protein|nr:MAG TPA: hypothetical protein [Caudoviricetes sp.]
MILIAQIIAWICIADWVLTSLCLTSDEGRQWLKRKTVDNIDTSINVYPVKAAVGVFMLLTFLFA